MLGLFRLFQAVSSFGSTFWHSTVFTWPNIGRCIVEQTTGEGQECGEQKRAMGSFSDICQHYPPEKHFESFRITSTYVDDITYIVYRHINDIEFV